MLDELAQHLGLGAEQEDRAAGPVGDARAARSNRSMPATRSGSGRPQEPAGPDHGLAVGQQQVALEQRVAQQRVLAQLTTLAALTTPTSSRSARGERVSQRVERPRPWSARRARRPNSSRRPGRRAAVVVVMSPSASGGASTTPPAARRRAASRARTGGTRGRPGPAGRRRRGRAPCSPGAIEVVAADSDRGGLARLPPADLAPDQAGARGRSARRRGLRVARRASRARRAIGVAVVGAAGLGAGRTAPSAPSRAGARCRPGSPRPRRRRARRSATTTGPAAPCSSTMRGRRSGRPRRAPRRRRWRRRTGRGPGSGTPGRRSSRRGARQPPERVARAARAGRGRSDPAPPGAGRGPGLRTVAAIGRRRRRPPGRRPAAVSAHEVSTVGSGAPDSSRAARSPSRTASTDAADLGRAPTPRARPAPVSASPAARSATSGARGLRRSRPSSTELLDVRRHPGQAERDDRGVPQVRALLLQRDAVGCGTSRAPSA